MSARHLHLAAVRRQRIRALARSLYERSLKPITVPVAAAGGTTVTVGARNANSTINTALTAFKASRTLADPGLTPFNCVMRSDGFARYIDLGKEPAVSLAQGSGWGFTTAATNVTALEILVAATLGGLHRVGLQVNDEWIEATDRTLPSDDGNYHLKFTWGTGARRKLRAVFTNSSTIRGININAGGVLEPIRTFGEPKILFVTDSYGVITGTNRNANAMPYRFAAKMGCREIISSASAGTGVAQAIVNGAKNAFDRRYDLTRCGQVDLVVISLGINDRPLAPWLVGSREAALISAAMQAQPNAIIHVVTAMRSPLAETPIEIERAQVEAFYRVADMTRMGISTPLSAGWLTGVGRVGAPTGVGNADTMIFTDGMHPSDNVDPALSGHDYLGGRIAADLQKSLLRIAA